MKKMILCLLSASLMFLAAPVSTKAFSGEVKQGTGSYSTILPAGAATPQNEIYKTANVTSPMPTNDWWSSLAWVPYSEAQYPHPLALKNQQNGLRIFNPSGKITVNPGYIAGWMDDVNDFTIGHSVSASFSAAKVDGFSDWFVKSLFQSGSNKMSATYGHGSPYVFFEFGGGNPQPDTEAPSSPVNVRATTKTASAVTLEWEAATDNVGVTGYIVYKDGAQAAKINGTSASITGLVAATTYSFTVKAQDAAGNLSAASQAVSVTTEPASGGNEGGGETEDYTVRSHFVSDHEALLQFTPKTASAYVDVHYTLSGGQQLNYRMTNNAGVWEQRVTDLSSGKAVSYWFTYEKAGLQYETPSFSYTHQTAATTTGVSEFLLPTR
ncbi:endo-1,4-beta-glucanase [Paenibacillus polymyxa]|nr:endo-1,4-beta-glucanase [Paenibacillus polymyxa]